MNRIRGFADQGQHATFLSHSFRFPLQGAFFVRQSDKLIDPCACRGAAPAENTGKVCNGQRKHQGSSLANLARYFEGVVCVSKRGLRIAKEPEGQRAEVRLADRIAQRPKRDARS